MALRLPFRRLGDDFLRAHRENRWRFVGDLLSRNFAEVESWTASPDSFPNKRVTTVIPTATRSTTSTTYVAWPAGQALTATFTKRVDATRLLVTLQASHYTSAGAAVDYGVSVDGGADVQIKNGFVNTASEHLDAVGSVEVSGLAAGSHTIALKARIGTGTLSVDNNDQVQLVVEEVA